jgi:hypothetical protein
MPQDARRGSPQLFSGADVFRADHKASPIILADERGAADEIHFVPNERWYS